MFDSVEVFLRQQIEILRSQENNVRHQREILERALTELQIKSNTHEYQKNIIASSRIYAGKSTSAAIEDVFIANNNATLRTIKITSYLLLGGWTTDSAYPRQAVASTLSREKDKFQHMPDGGYRLKNYNQT